MTNDIDVKTRKANSKPEHPKPDEHEDRISLAFQLTTRNAQHIAVWENCPYIKTQSCPLPRCFVSFYSICNNEHKILHIPE